MIYVMLGIIIFLLTFCAIGSFSTDYQKENNSLSLAFILGLAINIVLGGLLLAVYFIFFK